MSPGAGRQPLATSPGAGTRAGAGPSQRHRQDRGPGLAHRQARPVLASN